MDGTELTLEIPGGRIAGRSWGPDDADVIVCVHGWLDNAASFGLLAAALPERRFVAIDLLGHGNSSHHPRGLPYLFVDHVATLHHAIEAMGFERATLMGHSLGAGVCATWAGTFPEKVQRLILLEGLGPLTQADDTAPVRLRQALETQSARFGRTPPVYSSRDVVLQRLLGVQRKMKPESARLLLDRALVDVEGGVTWKTDGAL